MARKSGKQYQAAQKQVEAKDYLLEQAIPLIKKIKYAKFDETVEVHMRLGVDPKHALDVLQRLVDLGNTVVVIEHNLDVMKTADWIIDLGPDGGEYGGRIAPAGTPEQVARHKKSYTAEALRKVLP